MFSTFEMQPQLRKTIVKKTVEIKLRSVSIRFIDGIRLKKLLIITEIITETEVSKMN